MRGILLSCFVGLVAALAAVTWLLRPLPSAEAAPAAAARTPPPLPPQPPPLTRAASPPPPPSRVDRPAAPLRPSEARAEREQWMAALESSGHAPAAPWVHQATAALDHLRELTAEARFEGVQCWGGGCAMKGHYANLAAYWKARMEVAPQSVAGYPSGMKIITAPEPQADGEVESTWIFYAPTNKERT